MRNCPLCKTKNAHIYMKPSAWNNRHGMELKKCMQCRFVYSAESIYDYASAGTQHADTSERKLYSLSKKEHLDILAEEILKKTNLSHARILDIGCGVGLFALCFLEKGHTVFGIDPARAYLEKHVKLGVASASTLEKLNLEKKSCDLIIMKDVLEHVDDPQGLLASALSYLKPSGYLYIRVPNVYHYPFHWSIDTKSHINHFTPKQLNRLLEKFQLQKVNFINVYDISSKAGKVYHAIFWRAKNIFPLYHQISVLYQLKEQ